MTRIRSSIVAMGIFALLPLLGGCSKSPGALTEKCLHALWRHDYALANQMLCKEDQITKEDEAADAALANNPFTRLQVLYDDIADSKNPNMKTRQVIEDGKEFVQVTYSYPDIKKIRLLLPEDKYGIIAPETEINKAKELYASGKIPMTETTGKYLVSKENGRACISTGFGKRKDARKKENAKKKDETERNLKTYKKLLNMQITGITFYPDQDNSVYISGTIENNSNKTIKSVDLAGVLLENGKNCGESTTSVYDMGKNYRKEFILGFSKNTVSNNWAKKYQIEITGLDVED